LLGTAHIDAQQRTHRYAKGPPCPPNRIPPHLFLVHMDSLTDGFTDRRIR